MCGLSIWACLMLSTLLPKFSHFLGPHNKYTERRRVPIVGEFRGIVRLGRERTRRRGAMAHRGKYSHGDLCGRDRGRVGDVRCVAAMNLNLANIVFAAGGQSRCVLLFPVPMFHARAGGRPLLSCATRTEAVRRESLQAADAATQNEAIRREAVRRESLEAAQEEAQGKAMRSRANCCAAGASRATKGD